MEETSEEIELAREARAGRVAIRGRTGINDFLMLSGSQGVRATPGGRVSDEAEEVYGR